VNAPLEAAFVFNSRELSDGWSFITDPQQLETIAEKFAHAEAARVETLNFEGPFIYYRGRYLQCANAFDFANKIT
jgi:hypothetical protein